MACQTGILTDPNRIPPNRRGKPFLIEGTIAPVCFHDRWGIWHCGHDHSEAIPVPLQDAYRYLEGWTAQATI